MSRGFTDNFFFEVAKENIPDHSSIIKFGENPSIASAAGFEDIWDGGGTYVPPTQARLHDVASTDVDDVGTTISSGTSTGGSATTIIDSGASFQTQGTPVVFNDAVLNDDDTTIGNVISVDSEIQLTVARWSKPSNGRLGIAMESGKTYRVVTPASTGAAIFWVHGLDASFLEQEEFVVLNGQNDVVTASTYIRQYRARVFGDGGSGGAEGIVTSTAQTDNTVTCQVNNGANQTQMCIYTVPLNLDGYVIQWGAFFGTKQSGFSDVHLRAGTLSSIGYIVDQGFISTDGDSGFVIENPIPPFIPGGTDIWIEADSSIAAGAAIKASMHIVLIER